MMLNESLCNLPNLAPTAVSVAVTALSAIPPHNRANSAPRITMCATSVFIHWLSVKFTCDNEDEFLQEFCEVTGLPSLLGNVCNTTLKTYHCQSGITITRNNSMLLDIYGDEKLLIIPGRDCDLIDNWLGLYELMKAQKHADIKRIDLSVDVNSGLELSDIIAAYRRGRFSVKGKQKPEKSQMGDFVKDDGSARTVLIGKRGNAKVLRCYEIGRKLQTVSQQEVRLELELRRGTYMIPLDAIIDPTPYFCGAYPFLKKFGIGRTKRTINTEFISIKNYQSQVEHCRSSYGKLINLMSDLEPNAEAVVSLLKRVGYPDGLMLDQLKSLTDVSNNTLQDNSSCEELSEAGEPKQIISLDEKNQYFDDVISVDDAPSYLNISKQQFNHIFKSLGCINLSEHDGRYYRYQLDHIMNHNLVKLDTVE